MRELTLTRSYDIWLEGIKTIRSFHTYSLSLFGKRRQPQYLHLHASSKGVHGMTNVSQNRSFQGTVYRAGSSQLQCSHSFPTWFPIDVKPWEKFLLNDKSIWHRLHLTINYEMIRSRKNVAQWYAIRVQKGHSCEMEIDNGFTNGLEQCW